MRSIVLLFTRSVLGGYLAVHGAQKLFGSFVGPGLEATAAGFERMGLRPGKVMATLAGASELGGGVLTATGVANPLGPMAIAGTMVVAAAVHRKQGPMMQKGGYELPLTNFAVAVALIASGPGHLRLGPHLSKSHTRTSFVVGAGLVAGALTQLRRAEQAEAPAGTEDAGAGDPQPE